jgi:hypothetical protein
MGFYGKSNGCVFKIKRGYLRGALWTVACINDLIFKHQRDRERFFVSSAEPGCDDD